MEFTKNIKLYIKNGKIINLELFKMIEENSDLIDEIVDIKQLVIMINTAKDKYHNEESVISDYTYDKLIDKLEELDPTNSALTDVGYKIDIINKVNLPYHMGSMTKIKPNNEILLENWKKKYTGPYLVSNKLDGISAMLIINKNYLMKLYTRGDGKIGSDISHLMEYINIKNIENIFKYIKDNKLDRIVMRGELIIQIKTFMEKYSATSANPRNFVSGNVNAKKLNGTILKDIDLVFYEVIEPWSNIDKQYNILTSLKLNNSPFDLIASNKLIMSNLSAILMNRKKDTLYEIDGIIISDVNLYQRNIDGNPEYSFAYKATLEENISDATVEAVEWNTSKDGYLKPRIKITPIQLSGVQITYATAFNAKYVFDNKIGPGSKIKITRSGDVIPHIIKIVSPSTLGTPCMPSKTEFGEWSWNKTGVDIVINTNNKSQLIKTLAYFTKQLEIKNVDESTFKMIVDGGLIKKISDIFYLKKSDLLKLEGFQEKKTDKLLNELSSGFGRMHLADLMIASNIFGHGFGDRKIRKILKTYPNIILRTDRKDKLIELIDDIDGFDQITAKQFVESLQEFNNFLNEVPKILKDRLLLDTVVSVSSASSVQVNLLAEIKIVFTGFRNKDWEKKVTENGGEISTTVSKNTSLLVVNDEDIDGSSSKLLKAKTLNIKIIKKSEFRKYMREKYNIIIEENTIQDL